MESYKKSEGRKILFHSTVLLHHQMTNSVSNLLVSRVEHQAARYFPKEPKKSINEGLNSHSFFFALVAPTTVTIND